MSLPSFQRQQTFYSLDALLVDKLHPQGTCQATENLLAIQRQTYRQLLSGNSNPFVILAIGATFTVLSGKELSTFFAAMGAASAVMMLIFKDTILGFVASIQVTTNDMVRIGDRVTMPKHNADGNVMQISLNTVKVYESRQNHLYHPNVRSDF